MTEYYYTILPELPYIIWVNTNPHVLNWSEYGRFLTPRQAQRILQMLRDRQPLGDEDARKVVVE